MATQGQSFGDYELREKIAEGGMAELFLAKRKGVAGFEKIVAIKRILPELSWDENFVSMFVNEAKIAARLSHPNIVQIFDFGQIDNYYFIAMEFVNGQNLRTVQTRGRDRNLRMRPELAAEIVARAAAGLEHAHTKTDESGRPLGIIHRDVSPQNVLLSYDGDVKVVDFGIAKAVAENPEATRGVLKGKISYLSPEQVQGKNLDARTDVFSLGLILYELLADAKLFSQSDPGEALDAIVRVDSAQVAKGIPRLPKALREILRRALHVDPDQRFRSAGELQRALEAFVRQSRESGGTLQLSNFMRLLFDDKIGDDTLNRLRAEVAVSEDSAGAGSRLKSPRVWAGLGGAAAGIVFLFAVGPSGSDPLPPPPPTIPVPGPEDVNLQIALSALRSGDFEKALGEFDRLFAKFPDLEVGHRKDYLTALLGEGQRLLDEESAAATQLFEKAIELDPDSFEAHFNLAKVLTGRSEPDRAATHYEEAIRINPRSADALFNLGYIRFREDRLEDALRRYEAAAALEPEYVADVYYNIAACHEGLNQRDQAIEALRRGLEKAPERDDLKVRLQQLGGET